MWVDYTDYNKDCPKDAYPLLWINRLVNAIISFELLSCMNAYSGYNPIQKHPGNEEENNVLWQKNHLLVQSIRLYIDDMIVKLASKHEHGNDLHVKV